MRNAVAKTAVILFNLGGPGTPQDIAPFLKNFFSDKNIITLPALLRLPLARFIAYRRARGVSLKNYAPLGGRSPLLPNTQAQAKALQPALGTGYRVFVCMRYWHPMADEVARTVKEYAPEHVVLLPLYPQFSTTTTRSSFQDWERAAEKTGLNAPCSQIDCYPLDEGFINASAQRVLAALAQAAKDGHKNARVLFSAHGLPEKIIKAGDPYQEQCEQSAAAIAKAAGLMPEQWRLCYQSRVGPLRWIGPPVEEELKRAAADGVAVVIYPHSFVSEHVETLVEIEIEFRHRAAMLGVPGFYRAETVGIMPVFIEGLARMVREKAGVELCEQTKKTGAGTC